MNYKKSRIPDPKSEIGTVWDVFGEKIVCRVPGDQTFGRFTLVEETSPAGSRVPPHFHNQTDEIIYVLEGEYQIEIGEEKRTARKGDVVVIPRGTTHGFCNTAESESKMLAIITPSGFENFFAEVSNLETIDMVKIIGIGKRCDLEFVA